MHKHLFWENWGMGLGHVLGWKLCIKLKNIYTRFNLAHLKSKRENTACTLNPLLRRRLPIKHHPRYFELLLTLNFIYMVDKSTYFTKVSICTKLSMRTERGLFISSKQPCGLRPFCPRSALRAAQQLWKKSISGTRSVVVEAIVGISLLFPMHANYCSRM